MPIEKGMEEELREHVKELVNVFNPEIILAAEQQQLFNEQIESLFELAADLERTDFEKATSVVKLVSGLQAITDEFFGQDEEEVLRSGEEFKQLFVGKIAEVTLEFNPRFFDYVVNRDKVRLVSGLNEVSQKVGNIEFEPSEIAVRLD